MINIVAKAWYDIMLFVYSDNSRVYRVCDGLTLYCKMSNNDYFITIIIIACRNIILFVTNVMLGLK